MTEVIDKRHRIGSDCHTFKTGKTHDGNGYIVLSSKIWGDLHGMREHRVVAEQMLGRKLLSNEIVHHINGNNADNRPENLVVMPRADHPYIHNARGRFIKCRVCGKEKWYSPQNLSKLSQDYTCRDCMWTTAYTKTCPRCGNEFQGRYNERFCKGCSRKARGKRYKTILRER